MTARSWLRKTFTSNSSAPSSRGPSRRRRRLRPAVLRLDSRVALSTWAVTSSGDDVTQSGTLRSAVAQAQSGDTILLTAAVMNPIVLSHGELVLSQDVTITSVPARTPTISGDGQSRIFEIAAG